MIELKRDVPAVTIPFAKKLLLTAGNRVEITGESAGHYTILTDHGLARIEKKDADALGLEVPKEALPPPDAESATAAVWERLRSCNDPEIPVNIVELGLIYECQVEPHPEGGFKAAVKMTLTAPGCDMAPFIVEDARGKILDIPGMRAAEIELVFDPPWDPSRMSEAARLQLGLM